MDSLVVFADVGDDIDMVPDSQTKLSIGGPFGESLTPNTDNLILRALHAANADPHDITLEKNLPVSAGIGGGSANAAAVLRLCGVDDLHVAVGLGADVPVCLRSETAHMTGIGEDVTPLSGLGQLHGLLINPGFAVSTAEIFQAFDNADGIRETPRPMKETGDLLTRALDGRNDLEPIAISLLPVIGDVLRLLAAQPGCQLARMSGSGATCFGIFENDKALRRAEAAIKAHAPEWWIMPSLLGDAQ